MCSGSSNRNNIVSNVKIHKRKPTLGREGEEERKAEGKAMIAVTAATVVIVTTSDKIQCINHSHTPIRVSMRPAKPSPVFPVCFRYDKICIRC